MIFPDATLRLTVIVVIHFLSQKSHCAIATASSVVIVDERTNINPLRLLNRMESILFTDRTKLSILKSSDAMLKSLELKLVKKKKVRPTVNPTRIPTCVPSINKVMPLKPSTTLPKKTPPTKAVVPLEPTAPKPVGDKDNVKDDAPLQGNVPEGNKNDKSSPSSKSPGDKDDKVIGGTEPAVGAAKGKPAKVPQPNSLPSSKVKSTTKPSVAPTSVSKDNSDDSEKENKLTYQPTIKVESPTKPSETPVDDSGEKENQPTNQPTSKVESPTKPSETPVDDSGEKENQPTNQPISHFESPTNLLEKVTLSPEAVIPTAATQGNRKGRSSKPSAAPSSSPPGVTSISPPVDEALAAREKSALTSAKYFFYTFMACVAVCGVVYCIRRYGIRNFHGFISESPL
jgi:hypothetical protein